jgi:RNA polymerase sigma-70 factor (ECF subfamily)
MNDDRDPKPAEHSSDPDKLDRADFARELEPFRHALKLHCYRMVGSPHEAEDLVQETYLRAWRSLDSLESRGSLRAWLYRIATNACLNALASRKDRHRLLPDQQSPPTDQMPSGDPPTDIVWLAPYPDSNLVGIADEAPNPAARYEARESVQLAFVALIQQLPPRQRATLLLCDVLGWSAYETASLLGGSTASVNSALQRARATLGKRYPEGRERGVSRPDQAQRALIDRYVRAWEGADLDGFVSLLKEEATYAMPPWRQWYRGRDAIRAFFSKAWKAYGGFRLVATGANCQPAFGLYSCKAGESTFHAHSIQVLEIQGNAVSALTLYVKPLGPGLFADFGLPLIRSDAHR